MNSVNYFAPINLSPATLKNRIKLKSLSPIITLGLLSIFVAPISKAETQVLGEVQPQAHDPSQIAALAPHLRNSTRLITYTGEPLRLSQWLLDREKAGLNADDDYLLGLAWMLSLIHI